MEIAEPWHDLLAGGISPQPCEVFHFPARSGGGTGKWHVHRGRSVT